MMSIPIRADLPSGAVSFEDHASGLAYWPGDNSVILLPDTELLGPLNLSDVQRAVLVTRLRAWADRIERDGSEQQ